MSALRAACSWALGLVAFVTGATMSCGVVDTRRHAYLPFRVGVLPVQVGYVAGPDESETDTQQSGIMRLRFDPDRLGQTISTALGNQVFADAHLLEREAPSDSANSGDVREPRRWVRNAHELDCSLLLDCYVRVDPVVETVRNDRFWLNALLFLVGGPASWFVPDRSYHCDVRLHAAIHELEPILAGRATLEDNRARLATAHAQIQEVGLHLVDRAGANVLPYLGSVLIPASFLVPDGGEVASTLVQRSTSLLAAELARQIGEFGEQVSLGGMVTDMALADDFELRREENKVVFKGDVLLRNRSASRLASYRVTLGGQRVLGEFAEGVADGMQSGGQFELFRHALHVEVPDDHTGRFLEILCIAGGRDRNRRSFCVPLSWLTSRDGRDRR